jgi:hypothetical protein
VNDGVSEVEVKVTGTVPEIEAYSYEPPQSFLLAELTQVRDGGTSNEIGSWTAHHFTPESAAARAELDAAKSAIEAASGANTDEAEKTFANAVSAYENANFELATELANEAEAKAKSAQQSKQTTRLAMYAVGGLVAVGLLVGGVLWYRSQQDSYDRLG